MKLRILLDIVTQLQTVCLLMQEMRVQTLGWEDSLATHSSILAWEIPWTKKPGRLQSMGLPTIRDNLATKHTHRTGTKVRQMMKPGHRVKEAFISRAGFLSCFTPVPALAAQQIIPNLVASLVAQMVKNLPAVQESQVQSLDRDDLLEKGMATHSSILAGSIPWTEEPGGLQSMGSQRVRHD